MERYRGPFLGFTMPARRGRASAVDSSVETWVHSVARNSRRGAGVPLLLIRQALARHDETGGQSIRGAGQPDRVGRGGEPRSHRLIQMALARTKSSRAAEFAEQVRSTEWSCTLRRRPRPSRLRAADSTLPVRLTSFEDAVRSCSTMRLPAHLPRAHPYGRRWHRQEPVGFELAHAAEQEDLYPDGVFVELRT